MSRYTNNVKKGYLHCLVRYCKPVGFLLLPIITLSALFVARIDVVTQAGISALPLAIVLGMVAGHFVTDLPTGKALAWVRFCQQRLLRAGIILFGFSLTLQQLIAIGWQALVLDMLVVIIVLLAGIWLGTKVFKLPTDLAILTSAGSAICGAAAILATESILKPRQQHVSMAVATVVLFGTLAMFSYPFIYPLTGMTEQQFGVFIGSTVHEVAQAVAAGESIGESALQYAVVVKLIRVMLLAPFIVILSVCLLRLRGDTERGEITLPWFVVGFVVAVAVNSSMNSLGALASESAAIWVGGMRESAHLASQFMLTIAMAALGYQTRLSAIREAGVKPILLAACLFLLLLGGGFILNQWLIE